MRSRYGPVWLAIVLVITATVAAPATGIGNTPLKQSLLGETAPPVSLVSVDGANVQLESLTRDGKIVLLNFWGLRCSACLQEMPRLDDLKKKFGNDGLVVLGVNVDGVDGPTLKDLFPKTGVIVGYTLLADPEFRVSDGYRMTAAPYTVLISPGGKIVYIHEGYNPGDERQIEDAVVKALGKEKR